MIPAGQMRKARLAGGAPCSWLPRGRARPVAPALTLPPVGAGWPQKGGEPACWCLVRSRQPCNCSQCTELQRIPSLHPGFHLHTLQPTQSAQPSCSPWKSLVIGLFQTQEKPPSLESSQWPLRPPGPCPPPWPRLCLIPLCSLHSSPDELA